jgi:hypothetical protein
VFCISGIQWHYVEGHNQCCGLPKHEELCCTLISKNGDENGP